VAKPEREMMKNLGKYVKKKNLEVNVEKTKMMLFNKRKRMNEENEGDWEGRKIEQVNEFKYSERATDKAHIREIVKKVNKVVGHKKGSGVIISRGE
jgi:hypothetical protein